MLLGLSQFGCDSILGDFNSGDASVDGSTLGDGASGAANGTACTAGTQCASTFCADGVCCKSACSGTCEACNLGASAGTCSPIPVNTDPQNECLMQSVPDAGAADSATADAGFSGADAAAAGDAAAASDAAPSDAAVASDAAIQDASPSSGDAAVDGGPALAYNVPDGGVSIVDMACAGSCDGKGGSGGGSCVYPDGKKNCGSQFCNTSSEAAGFVCDGTGHCNLSVSDCQDYTCGGTSNGIGCGTSCSKTSDCLPTDYCDGISCHPKRGHGVTCDSPGQCASGYCDNLACCDTDCSLTTGGNCNLSAAKAGDCGCSACATGPCAVYYRDADGDGYGDSDSATSTVACAAGPVPSGYVTNKLDCDDGDARVNPAQTSYFSTPSYGKHTFDYNCDGNLTKGIPEYPSGYSTYNCGFCLYDPKTTPACTINTTTCTSAGAQSKLSCYYGGGGFYNPPPLQTASVSKTASLLTTDTAIKTEAAFPNRCLGCCTSGSPDPYFNTNYLGSGFAGTVGCGSPGNFIDCGTCAAASGAPTSYLFTETQTCN